MKSLVLFCWQWEGDSDTGQFIPCRYHRRTFSTAATCERAGVQGDRSRLWGHGGISLVSWAPPAGAGAAGACPNQGGKSPSSAGPGREPRLVQEGLCRHFHLCPDLLLSQGNLSTHVSVYSVVRWTAYLSNSFFLCNVPGMCGIQNCGLKLMPNHRIVQRTSIKITSRLGDFQFAFPFFLVFFYGIQDFSHFVLNNITFHIEMIQWGSH